MLAVAAVVDFLLWCLVLCLWVVLAGAIAPAAAGVPAAGASAAREAAAKPKVNKAVVIRVADFFMRSPNGGVGLSAAKNTTESGVSAEMKIISQ